MIGLSPNGVKIMVATQPVDFRRGMNGLVALVASALAADPYWGRFRLRAESYVKGFNFDFGSVADDLIAL